MFFYFSTYLIENLFNRTVFLNLFFCFLFLDEQPDVLIADGFYPTLFDNYVTLPPSNGVNFIVTVSSDSGGTSIEIPLKVTVDPFLSNIKDAIKALKSFKELYDSNNPKLPGVAQLIISDDNQIKQQGFRLFSNMVAELITRKPEDAKINSYIQDLKHIAVKAFMKVN